MVGWGGGGMGAQRGGGGAAVLGRGRLAWHAFAHGCVTAARSKQPFIMLFFFLRVLRTLWAVACAHIV